MKQSEAKFKSIFSLFFTFFALNFSLRFDLVIFASKRNKAKRNSSLFFLFFAFFTFFRFFSLFFAFFRLIFVSLQFFRLIFACFTFVFASDFGVSHRSESCEIRFFFASKRNEIFASISNFASEAKVRAHPSLVIIVLHVMVRHPYGCYLAF